MNEESLRKRLKELGGETDLMVNNKTGFFAYILDNNIIPTGNQLNRLVVFVTLHGEFKKFAMERNEFYGLFSEAIDNDEAVAALKIFLEKDKK